MVQMQVKSSVGEQGVADVRIGKNSIRVAFKESGIVYDLPKDQWEEDRPSGEYGVTLSKDNQKVISLRPVMGTYVFRFLSMGNRVNDIPEPAIQRGGPRQSKDGKKSWFAPDSIVWRTNLEVLSEGRFHGLTVMYSLPYIFAPVVGTPNTQLLANGRRDLETVERFLRATGFDIVSREIPFSTNVLPWLEKDLKSLNVPFLARVNEKGFVESPEILPPELAPKIPTTKKGKK
jgi:hypothetical protein